MDDEVVCPLCCEELDISDRQFFPCKCGYQVCMWCWHRIRESESGLCPACRTPYGDDPHEFSAVDVEEVLKANKEKEAAAKKERDRQRHQSDGFVSEVEGLAGGRQVGQMEVPKDRTQLANMRVIRRNLVYAVGLPPNIATEECLRKPEYFGQYGKIAKIVLNRSQTATGGDVRRTSASAYVTFVHKDDTLSCILALDGFYMDGRNVRSSYGTSKYCSAFIKNVRCNNPECTYLHQMGHIEDTFTKQEIQAGYVTSGRDVLARQQQIVQQALSAASGAAGSTPRRRTGGGGPSGTGKASSNPIFPPPSYDEPAKPSTASLVPTPPTISTQTRSASAPTVSSGSNTSGFPTIPSSGHGSSSAASASNSASSNVANTSRQPAAISTNSNTGNVSTIPPASKGTNVSSLATGQTSSRSGVVPTNSLSNGSIPLPPTGATAASVVAGVHSVSSHSEPPASHTTLTPLTPLKRTTVATKGSSKGSAPTNITNPSTEIPKPCSSRPGSQKKTNGFKSVSNPGSPINTGLGVAPNRSNYLPINSESISSIGGDVITAPTNIRQPMAGDQMFNPLVSSNATSRDQQSSVLGPLTHFSGDGLGGLGGEVFDGPLQSSSSAKSAIGSGIGKWDSQTGSETNYEGIHKAPSWNGTGSIPNNVSVGNTNVIGGGVIRSGTIGSGNNHLSGSTALASMLGINLPTGSGSLRESTSQLWTTGSANQTPISSLNGNSLPLQGLIGETSKTSNDLIGGIPIGGGNRLIQTSTNGSNSSDIALLQSLLPGVHITSGGNFQSNGFGSIGSGSTTSAQEQLNLNGSSGSGSLVGDNRQHFGVHPSFGQPIGTIGQSHAHAENPPKQRQASGSIW